MSQTIKRRF